LAGYLWDKRLQSPVCNEKNLFIDDDNGYLPGKQSLGFVAGEV
jgi:hypothetical protein